MARNLLYPLLLFALAAWFVLAGPEPPGAPVGDAPPSVVEEVEAAAATVAEPATVLDERVFDFLEDVIEPGRSESRRLAEVRAELLRAEQDGGRLHLVASAEGPFIEPPAGWVHFSGANPITAREMQRALDEPELLSVATTDASGVARSGSFRAGRRGSLPMRQRLPNGRFAFDAESAEEFLLEVVFDSGPLPEGEHRFEVRYEGELRLYVGLRLDAAGGELLEHGTPGPHTPSEDAQ